MLAVEVGEESTNLKAVDWWLVRVVCDEAEEKCVDTTKPVS